MRCLTAGLLMLPTGSTPDLQVDPLALACVSEVFQVIAGPHNPVWPDWDASATPVLVYLPGVQDVLLNHPAPPAGFLRAEAHERAFLPEGWTLHLRSGETLLDLDGQNTARTIGGVETLVVADPISNLRPRLELLLQDPRAPRLKREDLDLELLATNPYDQLGLVVHEAFHVHQARRAPAKGGNETALASYPWLKAEVTAGFALEGQILARALRAGDVEEAFAAGREWLAVRDERRRHLSASDIEYEDGTEFNEGLARYTEWRLCEVLEGREPGAALRWARGFRGYADLTSWREALLARLEQNLAGALLVNADPHGSGALRFKLYDSGMAQGALLDLLGMGDWHSRILEPETTLTELLREMLAPGAEELAQALAQAREAGGWPELLEDRRAFEQAGWNAAAAAAERILAGPALFTLDYSAVPAANVAWRFTPFGITRVDAARTIYSLTPLRAEVIGLATIEQDEPLPALHDSGRHRIQFQLPEPLDPAACTVEDAAALDLRLPGVHVTAPRARIRPDRGGVVIQVLPPR